MHMRVRGDMQTIEIEMHNTAVDQQQHIGSTGHSVFPNEQID